jgi:Flp pilus assembly protein TadB
MAGKSPIRGLHPVYRVYLAGFAMFVGAVASFAAGVKVLGFVFFALVLVCGGIMTVMLLTSARRRKAELRATPRADDYARPGER